MPRLWDINLFSAIRTLTSLCHLVVLHDVATFRILAEGDEVCCPWSIPKSTSEILAFSVSPMSGKVVAETWVQNRVSGHEMRIEKDEKVAQKENGEFIRKGDEAANLLPGVEEKLGKSVLFMSTMA